jgi:hypothetical protein
MNERQLRLWIEKYLSPSLPDFHYQGGLLYREPPAPLIRGFFFERVAHEANAFFVTAFIQATYVPKATPVLNMGQRLGRISGRAEKWWRVGGEDAAEVFSEVQSYLEREGLPYLAERNTLQDVVRVYGPEAKDPHTSLIETVAGAYALLGDTKRALALTDALIACARKYMDKSPWLQEVLQRAQELRVSLDADPRGAVRILEERSSTTLAHLGLEA